MNKAEITEWLKSRGVRDPDGAVLVLVAEVIALRDRVQELEQLQQSATEAAPTWGERFRTFVRSTAPAARVRQ